MVDLLRFRCQHCGADLGAVSDDGPHQCQDHPNGVAEVVEVSDGNQESV